METPLEKYKKRRELIISMNCTRCGAKAKPTGKIWKYNNLVVETFICETCKKTTFSYSKNGKVQYTIPKSK